MRILSRLIVFAAFAVLGCATSPLGRSQLLMVPEAQMDAMGIAAFDELAKTTPQATNSAQIEYVTCVANRITRALPATAKPYREDLHTAALGQPAE